MERITEINEDVLAKIQNGEIPMPEMIPIVKIQIFPNNINNKPEFKHIGADRVTLALRVGNGKHGVATGIDRGSLIDEDIFKISNAFVELINRYYNDEYCHTDTCWDLKTD